MRVSSVLALKHCRLMMRSMRCRAYIPEHDAYNLLRQALEHANVLCSQEDVDAMECIIAWDTVDEIGKGISRREEIDPLEAYCADNEDSDECRIYDL